MALARSLFRVRPSPLRPTLTNSVSNWMPLQVFVQMRMRNTRPASAMAGGASSRPAFHTGAPDTWKPMGQHAPVTRREASRPSTAMSVHSIQSETPLWKKQMEMGASKLLQIGVPRAQTPAQKTYVSLSAREHIKNSDMIRSKAPPPVDYPGRQRPFEQRGAGECGVLRGDGESCINFFPIPTCDDHKNSVMKHTHSKISVGCPKTPGEQKFHMTLTGHNHG